MLGAGAGLEWSRNSKKSSARERVNEEETCKR